MTKEHCGYTESDWKLFSRKIGDWQNTAMQKLCEKYHTILHKKQNAPATFWEIEENIRRDKKLKILIADMRRSALFDNLLSYLYEGTIRVDDLEGFSAGLKNSILFFYNRSVSEDNSPKNPEEKTINHQKR